MISKKSDTIDISHLFSDTDEKVAKSGNIAIDP